MQGKFDKMPNRDAIIAALIGVAIVILMVLLAGCERKETPLLWDGDGKQEIEVVEKEKSYYLMETHKIGSRTMVYVFKNNKGAFRSEFVVVTSGNTHSMGGAAQVDVAYRP